VPVSSAVDLTVDLAVDLAVDVGELHDGRLVTTEAYRFPNQ